MKRPHPAVVSGTRRALLWYHCFVIRDNQRHEYFSHHLIRNKIQFFLFENISNKNTSFINHGFDVYQIYMLLFYKVKRLRLGPCISHWSKVCPHGRTFVRRCPRTKVRVRLTFTSYSYFCTMLKKILSKRSYTAHHECRVRKSVCEWLFYETMNLCAKYSVFILYTYFGFSVWLFFLH